LKADADSEAVEEAMHREPSRSNYAELFRMDARLMGVFAAPVQSGEAFEPKERQEAQSHDRHNRGGGTAYIEDLRDDIEQHNCDNRPGAEAEQQMHPVTQADGGDATETG
jgi:hypothetical protein